MSLAFAIQRATPYFQLKEATDAMLNGNDPFSIIPGFEAAKNQPNALGGALTIPGANTLPTASSAPSIDPGFNINSMNPLIAAAGAGGGSAPHLLSSPMEDNFFSGVNLPGNGNQEADALQKMYDARNNFSHYAAPDGSNLPFVGPNYLKNKDMPGYWYDPYKDQYEVNQNTLTGLQGSQGGIANQTKLAQQYGILPKTPDTLQTLMQGLMGAGGNVGGSLLTKYIFDNLLGGSGGTGGGAGLASILGGGGGAAAVDPLTADIGGGGLTAGLSDLAPLGLSLF